MSHQVEQLSPTELDTSLSKRVRTGIFEYLSSLRLFSKNARLYLAGSFLMGVNFHLFQLLLNLYLKELGFAEGDIGLVASGRAIGMTIAAIPMAMLLSHIKLKPVLITGSILLSIFSFLVSNSEILVLLIGFSVLSGISFSFFRVASGPFFMRNSTPVERTHLFSMAFGMMLLAGTFGSLFAGKIVVIIASLTGDILLGYKYTLYLGVLSSFLALIPFGLVKAAPPSASENRIIINLDQLKKRGAFYFKISAANFTVGLGAGLIIPFLNLYFRDRFNQPPDRITFFYFLSHLVMIVGVMIGPILVKKFGLVRTVVFTQLASIPFMLVLSFSQFLPLVIFAFIVRAGLMNIGVPLSTNLGMELSRKSEHGLVNALLMVAWTGSWMVSAALGGLLIEHYGYTITINVTIIIYVFSALMFFHLFKNAETKKDGAPSWSVVTEEID
ncbi:MAG TPA: MFS transporter [candidate division Zixibacteria bacterium]|nr:MFS transporter [candidate division Zixibacteria bacterium]